MSICWANINMQRAGACIEGGQERAGHGGSRERRPRGKQSGRAPAGEGRASSWEARERRLGPHTHSGSTPVPSQLYSTALSSMYLRACARDTGRPLVQGRRARQGARAVAGRADGSSCSAMHRGRTQSPAGDGARWRPPARACGAGRAGPGLTTSWAWAWPPTRRRWSARAAAPPPPPAPAPPPARPAAPASPAAPPGSGPRPRRRAGPAWRGVAVCGVASRPIRAGLWQQLVAAAGGGGGGEGSQGAICALDRAGSRGSEWLGARRCCLLAPHTATLAISARQPWQAAQVLREARASRRRTWPAAPCRCADGGWASGLLPLRRRDGSGGVGAGTAAGPQAGLGQFTSSQITARQTRRLETPTHRCLNPSSLCDMHSVRGCLQEGCAGRGRWQGLETRVLAASMVDVVSSVGGDREDCRDGLIAPREEGQAALAEMRPYEGGYAIYGASASIDVQHVQVLGLVHRGLPEPAQAAITSLGWCSRAPG